MVGMEVGGQGADTAHVVGGQDVEQIVDGVGRVDDHRLAGRPVADQVDEVDHLPGQLVTDGEVAAGQQLPEVEPVAVGSARSPATRVKPCSWRSPYGRAPSHHSVGASLPAAGRPAVRRPPMGRRYHPRRPATEHRVGGTRGRTTHVTTDQAQPAKGAGLHTAAGMLRHWAGETPDAPMFVDDEGTVTWSEMYDRAGGPAGPFWPTGVGAGRPGRLPRPERHRVLRGALRCLAGRGGDGPGQLAPGPGRDGGHHRRRRRPGGVLRTGLRRGRQGDRGQRGRACAPGCASTSSPTGATGCRRGEASDPGFEPGRRRAGHPALHLGHDRPAQGCGAVGSQFRLHPRGGRRDLRRRPGHGLAGGHAALPHRRDRLGPGRHVPRGPVR